MFIQFARLIASARNNKGSTRLIDKNRVNLVDDCERVTSLNSVFFIGNHVITKIVKSHLVVCSVSNVCVVRVLLSLVILSVRDKSDGKSHKTENLAHPLGISAGKIIVYGYDMNALAGKSVKISGKRCDERFALACFHLGDSALVKNDTSEYLHGKVLHVKNSP